MKINKGARLGLIISLLVIISSIATSYSLWVITRGQDANNDNLLVAGCFHVSYTDLDSNNESTSINLLNTYPINDETGKSLTPYQVKIKNTCSVAADYRFVISDIASNTLTNNNLKFYLTKTGAEYGPVYLMALESYELDDNLRDRIESSFNVTINNSYSVATGVLNPNEEETYNFRLWVKEEATSNAMEKEFTSIISFEAYSTKPHD